MTYKQIEASREIRLWIGQIIVPATTVATTILATNPKVRQELAFRFGNIKNSIKNKFKKEA